LGSPEKNPDYFGLKNFVHNIPLGKSDLVFSSRACVGHPRNLHYKIAKNVYRIGFGPKIILSGCEISTQVLSIKVHGWAKACRARAGPAGRVGQG
jgi:hypothetical protein